MISVFSLRTTKKNWNEIVVIDDKKFWLTVKQLFSDEIKSAENIIHLNVKMTITENEKRHNH